MLAPVADMLPPWLNDDIGGNSLIGGAGLKAATAAGIHWQGGVYH